MSELEDEFGGRVDTETLRAVVNARSEQYHAASMQDFVPIFVERELRKRLNRLN